MCTPPIHIKIYILIFREKKREEREIM